MTVHELANALDLEIFNETEPEREAAGCYTGDLLSWVMSRADAGSIWVTIMSNVNVAAVAVLTDVAGVILAENTKPDPELLTAANNRGVNLYGSELDAFHLCSKLATLL